jgi:hypothetical protein
MVNCTEKMGQQLNGLMVVRGGIWMIGNTE